MTATNVMKEDEQPNQINEQGHFYRHFRLGLRKRCYHIVLSGKLLEVIVGFELEPQLYAVCGIISLNETTPAYATVRSSPLYSLKW